MSKNTDTILSVNIINHKGRQLFQDRWDVFVDSLRGGLQQAGRLDPESKENLFLFSFTHPFTALASCLESISSAKKSVNWKEEFGDAPIQIVMHLDIATDRYDEIYDVTAPLWNFLNQESIYLTRSMKSQWTQLMDGKRLPPLNLNDESGGVYLLKFLEPPQIAVERLFPYRNLALSGPEKECFYCGRHDHVPGKCPSKYLNMDTQGLPWIGFMSTSELSRIYKDVFTNSDRMLTVLAAGVEPAKIKSDLLLQVYIAYFDMFRVYQPRFLFHISFSKYPKWEEMGRTDKMRIDNNNLNLGFDCLRVQQYGHAHKWLSSDSLRNDGKEFQASVGLAFLALEQGREKDMGTLLERARDLADSEKNSIYISLLLARYYYLTNDLWKAEQETNSVLAIHDECAEAKFSKIKIGVRSGFVDQAFGQVVSLIKDSREYYMATLMDSGLSPIQGLVEEVLSSQFQNMSRYAKESLAEVNKVWKKLTEWLGERGEPGQANIDAVDKLHKHLDRGSYFDLLTVRNKSKSVVASCHRLRRERIEFLGEKTNKMLGIWEDYHKFWVDYQYQGLFKNFINDLDEFNANLLKLQRSIKNDKTLLFSEAMGLLDDLNQKMKLFRPQVDKMIWTRDALEIAKNFTKKLLVLEVALNLLSFVALTFFSVVVVDLLPDSTRQLLASSWFHTRTYMLTSVLAAPGFALALVILDGAGKSIIREAEEVDDTVSLDLSAKNTASSEPEKSTEAVEKVESVESVETVETAEA